MRLPISIAAHSPVDDAGRRGNGPGDRGRPLKPPRVPVVSNISALPLTSVDEIRRELVDN